MRNPVDPPETGGLDNRSAQEPSTPERSRRSDRSTADGDVKILASGARVALSGKIGGRGVHVIGQIVAARILGAEVFGLYALGWTVLRIATKLGPLGLDQAAVRFGAGYWQEHKAALGSLLRRCMGLALLSGVLLGGGLFFGAPILATRLFEKPDLVAVFRAFGITLPLAILLRVTASATRASQLVRSAVLSEDIGQPAAFLMIAAPWLLLGGGLHGALWSTTLSFALALGLAIVFLKLLLSPLQTNRPAPKLPLRELLAFSLPASLSGTFVMLLVWADRLMIGLLRPAADVGVYQAASQSAIVFAVILGAFASIFPPQIARLFHAGETERVEQLYRVSTKWGLYLSAPIFLLIFFESRNLLALVFGPDFIRGWAALLILTVGQLGNVATGGASQLLTMTGHQTSWLILSGAALTANLALNLLLIPQFGIEGAAAASAVSVAGLFLAAIVRARRVLGMWPYDARYLKGLLAITCATVAMAAIHGALPANPLVRVVIGAAVATGAFFLPLVLLGLDPEDEQIRRLVGSLWKRTRT